ncbi:MAG TPA: M50 family metallopeptidase [Ktedonosporobacter sp.]|nr:M50 family metallopeptidase [Ktedonosporobacter sp.]
MPTTTRSVCPQLRPDLVIEKQGEGKTVRYVISDPAKGRYFSCGAPQHALLMLLTGQLTTTEIATQYSAQTRILLRPEQLEAVLRRLEGLDFLLPSGNLAPSSSSLSLTSPPLWKSRFRRKMHWKLFPMQRILLPLQPAMRWLFSPAFFLICVLLILLTGWILLHGGWSHGVVPLMSGLYAHPSLSSWSIVLVALLITCYLHECGHVYALQHYGREPGYLGVGFAFPLGPIVYVEIGEVWRLAQARQRILVSLAGPLASLLVAGIGALGWWLLPVSPLWSPWFAAFLVMGLLTGVYNLLPLRGTDGYFALADMVGVPNLDRKASLYLKEVLLRPFRRQQPLRKYSLRQHLLFAGYGVPILLLKAWLIWNLGGFLLRRVVSFVVFLLHFL